MIYLYQHFHVHRIRFVWGICMDHFHVCSAHFKKDTNRGAHRTESHYSFKLQSVKMSLINRPFENKFGEYVPRSRVVDFINRKVQAQRITSQASLFVQLVLDRFSLPRASHNAIRGLIRTPVNRYNEAKPPEVRAVEPVVDPPQTGNNNNCLTPFSMPDCWL